MQYYVVVNYITDRSPSSNRDHFPIHTLESANTAMTRFDPADNPMAIPVDFIRPTDISSDQRVYGYILQNGTNDKFVCGRYGKGRHNLSATGKPRCYKGLANAHLAIFHFHKISPAGYNVLAVVQKTAPATLPGLES